MNHHSCILPREASREKHGTSAQIHLCFSLHNPEFHNLAGKLGGNPKFCLVARQHHVKAEILKNFDLNPWICGVHRKELFNLQPLRLQRSQAALFRAFKHAIFSTERLTPNYTTLFSRKSTTICECTWVHQHFNGWSLELQCRACLPNRAPKFCKPQTSREFSEDLCQKLDTSHWVRAWMWWFRGWQPAQGLCATAPVQTSTRAPTLPRQPVWGLSQC